MAAGKLCQSDWNHDVKEQFVNGAYEWGRINLIAGLQEDPEWHHEETGGIGEDGNHHGHAIVSAGRTRENGCRCERAWSGSGNDDTGPQFGSSQCRQRPDQ